MGWRILTFSIFVFDDDDGLVLRKGLIGMNRNCRHCHLRTERFCCVGVFSSPFVRVRSLQWPVMCQRWLHDDVSPMLRDAPKNKTYYMTYSDFCFISLNCHVDCLVGVLKLWIFYAVILPIAFWHFRFLWPWVKQEEKRGNFIFEFAHTSPSALWRESRQFGSATMALYLLVQETRYVVAESQKNEVSHSPF